MKVLVLGAGGKTGGAIVDRALEDGHEVTAFVHSPEEYKQAGARVIGGDARDPAAVLEAVRGQDAVLDALGSHVPFLTTTLETDTAHHVIEAMEQTGVRRLVVVSAIGEAASIANVHDYYKFFMKTVLRGVMKDKAGMEQQVLGSSLDWVIVRPAGLTDGERKPIRVVHPDSGEKVRFITRAGVAQFVVEQLTGDLYLRQAVGIADMDEVSA